MLDINSVIYWKFILKKFSLNRMKKNIDYEGSPNKVYTNWLPLIDVVVKGKL